MTARSVRLLLVLVSATFGLAVRGETQPTIRLPPFVVEGTAFKPKWSYGAVPGFEVLTTCTDATTQRFVAGLSRQLAALGEIAPPEYQWRTSAPMVLILIDTDDETILSQEMVAAMKHGPAAQKVRDQAQPDTVIPDQLFLLDQDSADLFVVLDNNDSNDNVEPEPGFRRLALVASQQGPRSLRQIGIGPNVVDWLLAPRRPPLPAWILQAVAGLYSHAIFLSDRIEFAPDDWLSDRDAEGLRRDPDYPRELLPMAELFRGPRRDVVDAAQRAALWRAQAELLLRWAIAGKADGRLQALWKLAAVGGGAPSEEAVRACFGLGLADLQETLSDYLPEAVSRKLEIPLPEMPRLDLELSRATPAQYTRIWGDWERKEAQMARRQFPDQLPEYQDQADRTLVSAYGRGERDPGALAVLGLYESDRGNAALAREALEAAVAARVDRPSAYAELARLRYLAACAKPSGEGGRLGPDQVDSVMEIVNAARRLQPPQLETYVVALLTWLRSAAPPSAADRAVLNEGRDLFPDNSVLARGLAALDRPGPGMP